MHVSFLIIVPCIFHQLYCVVKFSYRVRGYHTFWRRGGTAYMATIGSVKNFNPQVDDWPTYIERLDHYFLANDVKDDAKKRSILLYVCGTPTFKLLRSLVKDGKLDSVSYEALVKLLKDHYNPKPSTIVQRFHFNSRSRAPGESVANYVAALRDLALHCEYGDNLPEMLRDRLVCGVNHKGIQRKLLAESDLTYDRAFALAQVVEASERDAKALERAPSQPDTQTSTFKEQEVHHTQTVPDSRKPLAGTTQGKGNRSTISCYRCGGPHLAPQCKHKHVVCRACNKRGHFARECKSKPHERDKPPDKKTHYLTEAEGEPDDQEYEMFTLSNGRAEPYRLEVFVNEVLIQMELDTGAAISVINETTHNHIEQESGRPNTLQPTDKALRSYSGHAIQVLGTADVKARYGDKEIVVPIHVVSGGGPNLMGRDWLSHFDVSLTTLNLVETDRQLREALDKYPDVFTDELGCVRDTPVRLILRDDAQPKFYKPRPVPFSLREKVEKELANLQELGVISPVQSSPWAAPVVPVLKKNGKIRLCGDFKLTINQASPIETYPLPRVDELFSNLAGGKYFTKLDMSNAYLQLPLHPESRQVVTINTHRGLFQYNRLPFGVASAPAIFQRCMDTLLQGLRGVSVYIDDILITGASKQEHLENLEAVLQKLQAAGMRLNRSKCLFFQPSLEYLGHVISEKGIQPTVEKVRAIKEAPQPKNISELRSFLGLINYYYKFLPNLSANLTPLYTLLNKKQTWHWGAEQKQAFQTAQEALQTDALLVHYDPTKPIVLACDASQYGIGAVLSHVMEDKLERPIAYISRTLSPAEKHYSQLEREALAIIFAVKKFHNYIYGRHFLIESDHRPLMFLFGETNRIPQMASSRIQRWALTLSAYKYNIRYKAGKHLSHADALSRLPHAVTSSNDGIPEDVALVISHLSSTSVSAAHIKEWTMKDPILSCVCRFIESGWPETTLDNKYQPYASRKAELSVLDGCILRGSRVIVPPPGRQLVLDELHETHPGISKMKLLARSYIWWPGMDAQIEKLVKSCPVCQESRPSPPTAPLHPWEWPSEPWSRIHIDFAGPFLNRMYMVVVDAHSKWIDVCIMQSITAAKTIEQLRTIFSTHGLPRKVVTDNGPTFTSEEFRSFMSLNGITHITTAPYHPSSNGLAERAVQTFKQGLKRTPGNTIQERLSKFLFSYRITPHSMTGVSPATLLMGRRPRSRLDRLFPSISKRVETQQGKQIQQHDTSKSLRTFQVADTVYVKDFTTYPSTWTPGEVVKVTGPLSYHIELLSGQVVRRHVDAIRSRKTLVSRPKSPSSADSSTADDFLLPDLPMSSPTVVSEHLSHSQPLRRSTRQRSEPNRLGW